MKEKEFYCVSCKKRVLSDPEDMSVRLYKNKNREVGALKGKCRKCNTNLTKFIKMADYDKMVEKYE